MRVLVLIVLAVMELASKELVNIAMVERLLGIDVIAPLPAAPMAVEKDDNEPVIVETMVAVLI